MSHDSAIELCRRADINMFDTVRAGCIIQHVSGTESAAKFLCRHNVPFHVTHRVLLTPHLRRRVK